MKSLAALFFAISISVFGQDEEVKPNKNYVHLSAGVQTADFGRISAGLSYRHMMKEKWWLRAGFTYNSFNGKELMSDSLLFASNSIRIYRDQKQFNKTYSLNGGIEFYPIRYLSVGLDAVIGYNRDQISFKDEAETYDASEGVWTQDLFAIEEQYPDLFFNTNNQDQTSASINRGYGAYLGYVDYLVTGASLSISGHLPIGKRWELGLTCTSSFLRYTYLSNASFVSDLNFDGKNVYPGITNLIAEPPSFNLWNNVLAASVGFGF